MGETVFVVTGFELGWDCVVGVFSNTTEEELRKAFPEDNFHIKEHSIVMNFSAEQYLQD